MNLKLLREKATEICNEIKEQGLHFEDEAINWADLRCVEAEEYVTDKGDEGVRVYIEEAAPVNTKFKVEVVERLEKAGYYGIEVLTEW